MLELFKTTVQNRIKDGYCRAGRVLPLGESTLEALTAEQVAALQGDHRLVVGTPEPMEPNQGGDAKQVSENSADTDSSKALDDSALPADLNQLTVEQLKAALNARGVSFDSKAVKAELVALLTTATTPKDGE
jgi:Mu-like prophage fluMu protein gp35